MNKIVNNSILAFIARLAIICNIFTLLTLLILFVKGLHFPGFLSSYIIGFGIVMGPFVNISYLLIWGIAKIGKHQIFIPAWQTISIVLMLLVQILIAFL